MQTRDIREPDAEGEDGEAEEPESPNDDVAQEEDDNDKFGEDADWSDEEEGNECENLSGPRAGRKSLKLTRGIHMDQRTRIQRTSPFRYIADFTWRNFVAQFTCIYRPETQAFTDFNFKAKRKTLDGSMEELCGPTVRMWEESWSMETGEWVRGREEIKDDRDRLFLFVQMNFGNSGARPMKSFV